MVVTKMITVKMMRKGERVRKVRKVKVTKYYKVTR